MNEIKQCFDQQLKESNMKCSNVCDEFEFPVVKLGQFIFAEPESVKLFSDTLHTREYDGWNEKIDKFYEKFLKMILMIRNSIKEQET
eukprot:2940073-Rhodomonas_salina.2